jgi:hypothetical protein
MSGCCGSEETGRGPGKKGWTAVALAALLAGGVGIAFLPALPKARAASPAGDCCGGDGAKAPGGDAAAKPADAPAEAKVLLLDLGNEKCPIQGGKVDGKTWSEWNGLRIGHCCPMCVDEFKEGPEAALKKAGIEWKDAAAAMKKVNDAKAAYEKALAELKAKWKVVEVPAAGGEKK